MLVMMRDAAASESPLRAETPMEAGDTDDREVAACQAPERGAAATRTKPRRERCRHGRRSSPRRRPRMGGGRARRREDACRAPHTGGRSARKGEMMRRTPRRATRPRSRRGGPASRMTRAPTARSHRHRGVVAAAAELGDERDEGAGAARTVVTKSCSSSTCRPPCLRPATCRAREGAMVAALATRLCEQLRLVLAPTIATRLAGDYRTGKRINMRRVVAYVASGFRQDRIWLRRTRPAKRAYQVLLAIDDSRSMGDGERFSGAGRLALGALAALAGAMQQLEAGELALVSFGERVRVLHGLRRARPAPMRPSAAARTRSRPRAQAPSPTRRRRALAGFSFAQQRTCGVELLRALLPLLERARGGAPSASAGPPQQLVFVVSDGCFDQGCARGCARSIARCASAARFSCCCSSTSPARVRSFRASRSRSSAANRKRAITSTTTPSHSTSFSRTSARCRRSSPMRCGSGTRSWREQATGDSSGRGGLRRRSLGWGTPRRWQTATASGRLGMGARRRRPQGGAAVSDPGPRGPSNCLNSSNGDEGTPVARLRLDGHSGPRPRAAQQQGGYWEPARVTVAGIIQAGEFAEAPAPAGGPRSKRSRGPGTC